MFSIVNTMTPGKQRGKRQHCREQRGKLTVFSIGYDQIQAYLWHHHGFPHIKASYRRTTGEWFFSNESNNTYSMLYPCLRLSFRKQGGWTIYVIPLWKGKRKDRRKSVKVRALSLCFMHSLDSRLLHQGASATDIIQQYISCIRLMKLMDPSCEALLPIVRQVETYMM